MDTILLMFWFLLLLLRLVFTFKNFLALYIVYILKSEHHGHHPFNVCKTMGKRKLNWLEKACVKTSLKGTI